MSIILEELTIADMQRLMAVGDLTAVELTEGYLARIEAIDRAGPALNAIIELNPDALAIATQLDAERAAGDVRGPLHGIPILLKDNIDTGDRIATSAGSLALADHHAAQDSTVAANLRRAGAIILGKTNLSEWANFRSSKSSSGWSSRGGQTRNPYALDRTPCGSSSGSGVAVSANLCAAAIGTETDGSIVCPSHHAGIVGLKPTVGLVSRAGIVPISHSQDTAGPMTRTVADAAILLAALIGVDVLDPATAASQAQTRDDYAQFLDRDGLRGARIGVARNFFGFHPLVDTLMERAILTLRAAGAVVIDPANIVTAKQFDDDEFTVLLYEFKTDLNAYLAGVEPQLPVHSLAELIEFNHRHRTQVMPYFGQELLVLAEEKGDLFEDDYLQARKKSLALAGKEGIDAVMAQHNLDALIAPTGGPAWLVDWVNSDHHGGGSSSPAAVAGYPAITVPAGFVHGLPIGLTFMAGAWQEPTLIKLAYAFEQQTHIRRPPTFLRGDQIFA
ncbi:MAG: amidase [Caldilineaceae bacterium]|nr:amidase [Caldilineaceae bacterium]MBP8106371.1 amidase [Caldilineaceae bacterium]MBP8121446.1 amidase [Caldilineaceae bacterium]MBP9073701.1 amidase [Caldilineaceae bacterium]